MISLIRSTDHVGQAGEFLEGSLVWQAVRRGERENLFVTQHVSEEFSVHDAEEGCVANIKAPG